MVCLKVVAHLSCIPLTSCSLLTLKIVHYNNDLAPSRSGKIEQVYIVQLGVGTQSDLDPSCILLVGLPPC
ncbi:unnamed protein product [Urochloa humidicola]